jgi:arylformamidase
MREGHNMTNTLYKGYRPDEMEYQYNPRESVPEYPALAQQRAVESKKVRATAKSWLNVAYGQSPRELLDIYAADQPGGPVLVYIHGGYWRSGSKEDNCNLAPTFTQRGATVVLVEYDLCPQVTVSAIVRQTRSAVGWVGKNIVRYSGNPSRLFVSGHSAGGHLTAMALAHDWAQDGLPKDLIKGAVVTSGVYDLEMVMKVSVQEQVRMTPEIAKQNSPLVNPPKVQCPLVVAVGGAEPKGWQKMSEDYFNCCKEHGIQCEYLIVPGANHYTMSAHLTNPNSPLTQAMLKQMGI